jgi:CHC2 zinc finger
MARYSDTVLDEIRARVDIVDLIGSRMQLKRAGGTYKGVLSLPQGEDALVQCQSEQAVL